MKLFGVVDELYGVGVEMLFVLWLLGLGGRMGGVVVGLLFGGKFVICGGFGKFVWVKGVVI